MSEYANWKEDAAYGIGLCLQELLGVDRYADYPKKKAARIDALEQRVALLEQNIELLTRLNGYKATP